MSKHTSYRGTTIDMDSMRRENEKVPAIGNMKTNAKGDKIKGGVITKTADDLARERGRVKSVLVNTGLKGPMPPTIKQSDQPKSSSKGTPVSATTHAKKPKETELPSGDIIIEDNNGE